MLKSGGNDVRHGTSCSLLTDAEARSYGIAFNSGFGECECSGRRCYIQYQNHRLVPFTVGVRLCVKQRHIAHGNCQGEAAAAGNFTVAKSWPAITLDVLRNC
jgi:hypothetical protein